MVPGDVNVDVTMVGTDLCHLTGSPFSPNSFDEFRRSGDFCDVVIVTNDDVTIPAHKLVLSAGSDFFKEKLLRMQQPWNPEQLDQTQARPFYTTAVCLDAVSARDMVYYSVDFGLKLGHSYNFRVCLTDDGIAW